MSIPQKFKVIISSLSIITVMSTLSLAANAEVQNPMINEQNSPRIVADTYQLCGLGKNDNFYQFLNRLAFRYQNLDQSKQMLVIESVYYDALNRYKVFENQIQNNNRQQIIRKVKVTCFNLAVSLARQGIIKGDGDRLKLKNLNAQTREAILTAAGGDFSLSGIENNFLKQLLMKMSFVVQSSLDDRQVTIIDERGRNVEVYQTLDSRDPRNYIVPVRSGTELDLEQ